MAIRQTYDTADTYGTGSTGYGATPGPAGTGDPAMGGGASLIDDPDDPLADDREEARLRIEAEQQAIKDRDLAAWRASQQQPAPTPVPTVDATPSRLTGAYGDVDAAMARLLERAPITAPTAAQIAATSAPTAATIGGVAAPTAARVGSVATVAPTTVQRVSLAAPATVQAALAEKSGVGARQLNLAELLMGAAQGDEEALIAERVRRDLADQEAAQMSLAASAGPAQRSAALLAALNNVGRIRGSAASEIATRNQAAKTEARNALIGLLGGTRGQDIAEAQANQQAINAARALSAELGTRTNIAGGEIAAGQANLEAELASRGALANAAATNTAALQQAGFQQQANLTAAEMEQQRALERARLEQQAGLAGAEMAQRTALSQAELDQQAGLAGASLTLQDQAQRDSALMGLLNTRNQLLELEQRGDLSEAELAARRDMLTQQLAGQLEVAQLGADTQLKLGEMQEPGFWDRLTTIVSGGLPLLGKVL